MSNINVNLEEISNLAAKIRNINSNLDATLNEVKQQMENLSLIWISEGSNTLMQRFNFFQNRFLQEKEIIESYAKFLDYTVANYESIESAINANATNFS